MKLSVSIIGAPEAPPEMKVEDFGGTTLSELRDRLGDELGDRVEEGDGLLAFVNGRAVRDDWESVALGDADEVLFVIPISGG